MVRFGYQCLILTVLTVASTLPAPAQDAPNHRLADDIDRLAREVEEKVVTWRRDIHQNPELSNREFRTAELVAKHLRGLGIEVRTEVAHTGVVGLLRGRKDGPVVALRADMDALPVTEAVDLPFASKVRATYNGREVGVMHACGHDNHVAILMGVAEVLARLRDELPGSVKFLFQPAEEGAPEGEEGGAELMIREGALENPRPDAVFGLHVMPAPVGMIAVRSGPFMASSDGLKIVVRGRQTHGAAPWGGVDPIVTASQIVVGLQTIVSRQINITAAPAIVTLGSIHGGVRGNIIPDEVEMVGTIRTFDPAMREDIHRRIRHIAESIASGAGATAEVTIDQGYPVTVNHPRLTERMRPVLESVAGEGMLVEPPLLTVAEDFSYFQREVPGLYFSLGVTPPDAEPGEVASNHSPYFFADERALKVGVRALAHLTVAYMEGED